MNQNLAHIIKIYSTQDHKSFSSSLIEMSKDDLIALFADLLTMYINDKNSSTIREFLTVTLAGYTHNTKKIGFNGFKQSSIGTPINCEAKPKNFSTQDYLNFKQGLKKTNPSKLDGSGSFNDYTWARFKKDKQSNFNMLISGFVDGQLVYLLEIPFNYKGLTDKLKSQLQKILPDGDIPNRYVRGANFTFNDYKNAKELKPLFIIAKPKLQLFKNYIHKALFAYLDKEARQ